MHEKASHSQYDLVKQKIYISCSFIFVHMGRTVQLFTIEVVIIVYVFFLKNSSV